MTGHETGARKRRGRSQVTPERAQRRAEIVALRTARHSWADIGARYGIAPHRACEIYRNALDAIPAPAVAEHREEMTALADAAIAELVAIARDETVGHRDRIAAWTAVRGWAQRLARLHGLDAPTTAVIATDAAAEPTAEHWHLVAARVAEIEAGTAERPA
ncbi:MAG: hypothetical protein L0K86_17170 [Actinomycetia bacterium]|nr:hypothetical protein [Actinomycetes bacterium]